MRLLFPLSSISPYNFCPWSRLNMHPRYSGFRRGSTAGGCSARIALTVVLDGELRHGITARTKRGITYMSDNFVYSVAPTQLQ